MGGHREVRDAKAWSARSVMESRYVRKRGKGKKSKKRPVLGPYQGGLPGLGKRR